MSITISAVGIPWAITILLLLWMARPYQMQGSYDFGWVFRMFWLIPILGVWVIYLGVTI